MKKNTFFSNAILFNIIFILFAACSTQQSTNKDQSFGNESLLQNWEGESAGGLSTRAIPYEGGGGSSINSPEAPFTPAIDDGVVYTFTAPDKVTITLGNTQIYEGELISTRARKPVRLINEAGQPTITADVIYAHIRGTSGGGFNAPTTEQLTIGFFNHNNTLYVSSPFRSGSKAIEYIDNTGAFSPGVKIK